MSYDDVTEDLHGVARQLPDRLCQGLAECAESAESVTRITSQRSDASGDPLDLSDDSEFLSEPIGDFQIISELGRGGMGVVYEAIQVSLGRHVALKVLPLASSMDAVRLQRFRNEATAVAQLHHANIVPIFAVGNNRGIHYFAMQLIAGQTLAHVIEEQSRSRSRNVAERSAVGIDLGPTAERSATITPTEFIRLAVQWIVQATLAIEHAHQFGVVHRDLKPANLMLEPSGKVWVTDFGLAQFQQADSQLTGSGDALGTLRYMSPEQAAGNRAVMDHRTDIYSLGVTLYELLTLKPAIDGAGYHEMLNHVIECEPPTPRSLNPSLPIDLDTIVRKAISKVATERYRTAQAFADDLQRWLDDKPILAQPPTLVQRAQKWRRRHHILVNAGAGLLLASSLFLAATTVYVVHEHSQTKAALESERLQRQAADQNFLEARRAVDVFSRLSENELAHRPGLINLRRTFLETSLDFYRRFADQQVEDPAALADLESTAERIENMVHELRELESSAPLLLLADVHVQTELGIDSARGEKLLAVVEEVQSARRSFGEHLGELDDDSVEAMEHRLATFVKTVSSQLDASQLQRLNEISRQQHLPYTFNTTEVNEALQLSRDQRSTIGKMLDRYRPGRHTAHANLKSTLQQITSLLSSSQNDRWNKMIGKPFID